MTDNTKPNPKYYIGKAFGNPLSFMLGLGVVAATAIVPTLDDNYIAPDQEGTAEQSTVLATHTERFETLKDLKEDLNYAQAQAAATGNNTEVTQLKENFGAQALSSFVDLYVSGASQDGAALSEENFDKLRHQFAENIMDPETFGFQADGHLATGLLDESMDGMDFTQNDDQDRFQIAQQLDQKMAAGNGDLNGSTLFAILFSMVFAAGFLPFCAGTAQRWSYREDKRIPRKTPKKATRYGNH